MDLLKRNPLVIFFESLKSRSQAGVGIAILLAVVIAMIWANSPFNEYYIRFIQTEITLQIDEFILSGSLVHWVNDGLMAVFFLFVTDLAFQNEELKFVAKLSILFTSTVAGILSSLVIWISSKPKYENYT